MLPSTYLLAVFFYSWACWEVLGKRQWKLHRDSWMCDCQCDPGKSSFTIYFLDTQKVLLEAWSRGSPKENLLTACSFLRGGVALPSVLLPRSVWFTGSRWSSHYQEEHVGTLAVYICQAISLGVRLKLGALPRKLCSSEQAQLVSPSQDHVQKSWLKQHKNSSIIGRY